MRVAPVALMLPRGALKDAAIDCSALRHGHPTGQLAAAAWAELLREVAEGAQLEDAAEALGRHYADIAEGGETAAAIRRALQAPRDGPSETIENLGGGWVAQEALSIALYACLVEQGFEDALRIAVTHGATATARERLLATCWA